MMVRECFKNLREEFNGIIRTDFEYLFCETLGINREDIYLSDFSLYDSRINSLRKNLVARMQGKPVEYILGKAVFMGFVFDIEEGIFIPKNSTETLLEKILTGTDGAGSLLDVGCGCGAIAVSVSLLKNLPATAVDTNARALKFTERNAEKLGARVTTLESDIFENVSGKFDIIASNPPYVGTGEKLDREVLCQNPKALFAGDEGMDCIKKIARDAGDYLNPGGRLFLEVGYDQSAAVRKMLEDYGYGAVKIYNDLSGIPRVLEAQLPKNGK